jgi:hypothetical protein
MRQTWCKSPYPAWPAQARHHLYARMHRDAPISRCFFIDIAGAALDGCHWLPTMPWHGEARRWQM